MAATIDLRSDTVTKPTAAMRAAMFAAEVGDDVYGEDPSINLLEERLTDRLGMESAIFVPSGTMANQIAVRLHCRPGDELLCEATSHVYLWEGGAPAALSGVTTRMIDGTFGVLTVRDLEGKLHPPDDIHSPTSRLVCLENTHNRGGGRVYPVETVREVSAWARRSGLAMHLDGARLWNAVIASGIPARGVVRALRHRIRLLQQGTWSAGRVGAGRTAGLDPPGSTGAQALRRSYAASRVPGRGVPVCDGSPR